MQSTGPGSIPLRCYLPRPASLRPAARRFFSNANANATTTANAATSTAVTPANTVARKISKPGGGGAGTSGRYYYPDKPRDFNNNNSKTGPAVTSTAVVKARTGKTGKPPAAAPADPSTSQLPSRWYTVLALPFPDQTVGRRDILGTAYGRRRRQQLQQHSHLAPVAEKPHARTLGAEYRLKRSVSPPAFTVSASPSPAPPTSAQLTSNLRMFATANNGTYTNGTVDDSDDVSSIATSTLYRRPPTIEYYSSDPQPSNRTANQHYRHRASPDCNTVASFSSSSSESRNGLNRYYRQAWENLHESASKGHNNNSGHSSGHSAAALKRKETMDAPPPSRSRSRENLGGSRSRDLDRSRENLAANRGSRDYPRDSMAVRDGSEMVVSDVCVKGEKKRHHHHHHKSSHRGGATGNNENDPRGDHHRREGRGDHHERSRSGRRDSGSDFREPNIMGSGGNGGRRGGDHRHY
ncbi:conserved hypothetical protein [Culex quinquefasciatus]|uniref:Uncharacterized protein n=1 Tax=Culex quinquefasciatus TaxID=7176 RepID=B0XHT6_CULQU|nr:conserved hypothetical protein [Culex quinquefasciatus]|eukprot:XP_001869208.1 conserved hypothetical protein [Culex quinquefasciatus]